jgi:hypothetical protein
MGFNSEFKGLKQLNYNKSNVFAVGMKRQAEKTKTNV